MIYSTNIMPAQTGCGASGSSIRGLIMGAEDGLRARL